MGIGLRYNRGTELQQPSSLFMWIRHDSAVVSQQDALRRHMYYTLKETQHTIHKHTASSANIHNLFMSFLMSLQTRMTFFLQWKTNKVFFAP